MYFSFCRKTTIRVILLLFAKAKLKAYQWAEEIENEKDPVKDNLLCAAVIQTQLQTTPAYLPPLKEPKHLRLDVSTSNSVAKPTQQLQDLHKSPSEGEKTWSGNLQRDRVQLQDSSSNADKTADIVTAAVDIFSLSRLPTPEPTIVYALILWKVWTQKESFYKYVEFECLGYRSPE